MSRRGRAKARHRAVTVTAYVLIVAWLSVSVALLWPYRDVTFPQGNVGAVTPTTVQELGTVTVTFPAYCNFGQVVTVNRWADIYMDGQRRASERLGTLTFYPTPGEPECRAPDVQPFGLTTAFKDYTGKGTVYRIRTETTYRPNPIRTVTVEASTEPFTVTAR